MTGKVRAGWVGGVALVTAGAGVLIGTAQAATAAAGDPEVKIVTSQSSPRFRQAGEAAVRVEVAALHGGGIGAVAGRGSSVAMDFPDYRRSGTYPRAVLRVSSQGGNELSPGSGDFRWGADFRLDPSSEGRSVDDGDNLMQRGLWSQPSQYKAQVDGGEPSCSVKGSGGRVTARLDVAVRRGEWYRLRCIRTGDSLRLKLVQYLPDGGTRKLNSTARGRIGSVRLPASVPLSVGGKLAASGAIASGSTDQFNGLVTKPLLRIG